MATKKQTYASGRPPEYDVAAMSKEHPHKGRVGVAWANADGSIRIVLNPFVVLDAAQELVITLFKRTAKKSAGRQELGAQYCPPDVDGQAPPF